MSFISLFWMFSVLAPLNIVWTEPSMSGVENNVTVSTILRPQNLTVDVNTTKIEITVNITAARISKAIMRRIWLRKLLNNGTLNNTMSGIDASAINEVAYIIHYRQHQVNLRFFRCLGDRRRTQMSDFINNADDGDDDGDLELSEPLIIDDDSLLFEGDIRGIDPESMKPQVGVQATATTFEDTWPDGVIPYLLGTTGTAALGPFLMERVPEMMSHISQVSCVRFRKWKGEVNYVHIVSGGLSCSSYVGMQQKKNIVQYGRGRCKSDRKILHELLHTLGVYHEMARNDRDKYIKIIPENIKLPNGLLNENFQKYKPNDHGLPFDFDSVMMYESTDFAKDKSKKTIEVIGDPNRPLGKAQRLTNLDIFTLNDLYKCKVPDCEDPENGKFNFNNKCYYVSSNCVAHAQAEAACQTNGGKLAHIPSDLIAVFFKAVKKDDAMYDIYWVAPEPAPAKNDDNEEEEEFTDAEDPECTGIISGEIKKMPCEYCSNVLCEIQP